MTKTTAITLVALAGSLGYAGAEGRAFGDGDLPTQIKELADADGDGVVTEEEWQAFRDARREQNADRSNSFIDQWDLDGDGVLSAAEREAAREAIRERARENRRIRFNDADTDGDGALSRDEFTAIPAVSRLSEVDPEKVTTIFDRLDADDDELISAEEFLNHLGHRRPMDPRPPRPDDERPDHPDPDLPDGGDGGGDGEGSTVS